MHLLVKRFEELTPGELYSIMQARETVFLLEQHIVCQDFDNVDRDAVHIALMEGEKVLSYLRLFEKDGDAVIGRVLSMERGKGYGLRVMAAAKEYLLNSAGLQTGTSAGLQVKPFRIILHSQSYAVLFYEKCGYRIISEEFLEEGIPHRMMELRLDSLV